MTDPIQDKPAEQKAPAPAAPAAAATPAAGAPARKPAAKPATEDAASARALVTRRRLIWACVWGYLGVNLLMFARYFFPRALFEPSTIFTVGYPADFTIGVETKFQQQYRVWVVRNTERLFVIYARCTHLGCTPDWKQSENKFKCPCHGSGYDSEGVNFEGPAPRPMDRAQVTLDATGRIVVDTAKLYVRDPNVGRDEFNNDGAFLIV